MIMNIPTNFARGLLGNAGIALCAVFSTWGQGDTSTWAPGEKEVFDQFQQRKTAGEIDEAIVAGMKWLGICENHYGADHRNTASSLHELGALCRSSGRYAEAEVYLKRAWSIRKDELGETHPDTAASLEEWAMQAIDMGSPKKAKLTAGLIVSAKRQQLMRVLPVLNESERLDYVRELKPYDIAASLESGPAMADAVLMAKGIVLESLLEDRRSRVAARSPKLVELVARIQALKKELNQGEGGAGFAAASGRGTRWAELEQLESELARQVSGAGDTRRSLSITADQVAGVLPSYMALVEYLRYNRYLGKGQWEESYGAVVVRPGKAPDFVPCGAADTIDDAIFSYRASIERVASGNIDDRAVEQGSQTLHDRLISKLYPYLKGVRQMVISPDGTLNFLPFATLLDPQSRMLAEKVSIYYLASGRDIIGRDSVGAWIKGPAFVLGDPGFAATGDRGANAGIPADSTEGASVPRLSVPDRTALSALDFSPLPGARAEVAKVSLALNRRKSKKGSVKASFGNEATERKVRSLKSPEVLHLATHGFFLSATESEDPDKPTNPMLRSGLALSGAQNTVERWKRGDTSDPDDDGILFAAEIGDLDLRGTDLVTLSACQTAMGEAVPGEGVMGMRRAFAMAGARNVLMTLWDIADEQTASFMGDFYRRYGETNHAPRALSEVQGEWLRRLRQDEGMAVAAFLAGPFVVSAQAPRQPVNSLGMRFVAVPGTDVLMSIWETRVKDYAAYAQANSVPGVSWEDVAISYPYDDNPQGPNHPVVNLSWVEAKDFCRWLSEEEGITYRLPTDHEWSLAAGIGRMEDPNELPEEKDGKVKGAYLYHWGSTWPPPREAGNYAGQEFSTRDQLRRIPKYTDEYPFTAAVGRHRPNRLGFFDLGGNAWEWCEDWFGTARKYRVLRGGSCGSGSPELLRSSDRLYFSPDLRNTFYGFRCVVVPDSTLVAQHHSASPQEPKGAITNSLGMEFVPVPGTNILMSTWETRIADYAAYAEANPGVNGEWKRMADQNEQGPDHPVGGVNWDDAIGFCEWVSAREGKVYRLPTDREWSLAAGIGVLEDPGASPMQVERESSRRLKDFYPWGKVWPPPKGAGNYDSDDIEGYTDPYPDTSPVGSFNANRLQIFDLGGNVAEWCLGASTSPEDRVLRGGYYMNSSDSSLRVSDRLQSDAQKRYSFFGFRCVIERGATAGQSVKPAPGPAKTSEFTNSLGMEFVPIAPDESPGRQKRILMCIWETRVRDYEAFAAANPQIDMSWKEHSYSRSRNRNSALGPDYPVIKVSYEDAKAFCAWLSQKEGRLYRLPSDHEWSIAVGIGSLEKSRDAPSSKRGRVRNVYPWGTTWPPPKGAGNYRGEESGERSKLSGYIDDYLYSAPVGSFEANDLGFYDLGGNVGEWCEDPYLQDEHVIRGGTFGSYSASDLLSSHRVGAPSDARTDAIGFRCVVELKDND